MRLVRAVLYTLLLLHHRHQCSRSSSARCRGAASCCCCCCAESAASRPPARRLGDGAALKKPRMSAPARVGLGGVYGAQASLGGMAFGGIVDRRADHVGGEALRGAARQAGAHVGPVAAPQPLPGGRLAAQDDGLPVVQPREPLGGRRRATGTVLSWTRENFFGRRYIFSDRKMRGTKTLGSLGENKGLEMTRRTMH